MSNVVDADRICKALPDTEDLLDLATPAEPQPQADADDADGADVGSEVAGKSKGKRQRAQDALVKLAQQRCQFFCTPGRSWKAYADVQVLGHRETMQVDGDDFRSWLTGEYYGNQGVAPGDEALNTATRTLCALAKRGGLQHEVHLRTAGVDGCLYLDLGDETWQTVRVDSEGWRIIADAPVRFRRPRPMLALPTPKRGGIVDDLWKFIAIKSGPDRVLTVAWLLAALAQPAGALPVLVVSGEQGTAKSTATRFLLALVSPAEAPLLALPTDRRDLAVIANAYHVLAFDNVSGLTRDQSDALCTLSTGSGFATRKCYSDADLTLFQAKRPMILNGIPDFVDRPDLADRSLRIELQPIEPGERRTERDLWREFKAAAPLILGGLLDIIAVGFANLQETPLADAPSRLADFEHWMQACEPALWASGTFEQALRANREASLTATLEGDLVAQVALKLADSDEEWTGTASGFIAAAVQLPGDGYSQLAHKGARFVSDRLKVLAPALREQGVAVERRRTGRRGERMIQLRAIREVPERRQ